MDMKKGYSCPYPLYCEVEVCYYAKTFATMASPT